MRGEKRKSNEIRIKKQHPQKKGNFQLQRQYTSTKFIVGEGTPKGRKKTSK